MAAPQLNYHHLRLFWEVSRVGSLRAAAKRLHLSEPTISAQIKVLEKTLGKRLLDRTSRGLTPTSSGRLMADYAAEIFSLGADMVRALQEQSGRLTLRLHIGITDSLPKLVAWRLIRPVMKVFPNLQLSCAEGHAQELLGQLAAGRLDVVISDEEAPPNLPVKAFTHHLGESQVVFCAAPGVARSFSRNFPASLKDAPLLLPGGRTAWRHGLDRWFESHRIHPHVVAEFDDAALMKTAAADGLGVAPVAQIVLNEAADRYGLIAIGKPVRCGFSCHLITLDRSMKHPALSVIARESSEVFHSMKAKPTGGSVR